MARRLPEDPTGLGQIGIPYDQSGGMMAPGMEVPQPGGAMKKMSLEFIDPAQAAAAAQQPQAGIPPGAGILPSGAQGAGAPPAGAAPAQPPMQDPMQQMPGQEMGQQMPMLGGMMQQEQGPDSSLFSDEQLAGLVQEDPMALEGQNMSDQIMDPSTDPQMQEMLRQRLMQAAGRQMGGF